MRCPAASLSLSLSLSLCYSVPSSSFLWCHSLFTSSQFGLSSDSHVSECLELSTEREIEKPGWLNRRIAFNVILASDTRAQFIASCVTLAAWLQLGCTKGNKHRFLSYVYALCDVIWSSRARVVLRGKLRFLFSALLLFCLFSISYPFFCIFIQFTLLLGSGVHLLFRYETKNTFFCLSSVRKSILALTSFSYFRLKFNYFTLFLLRKVSSRFTVSFIKFIFSNRT